MYAVVRTGGKQHRVVKGERIKVDKLSGEVGSTVSLNEVLMLGGEGSETKIGRPQIKGAAVSAKILAHGLGPKVIAFKRRRRKGFHKAIGHRQQYTEIEITGIEG